MEMCRQGHYIEPTSAAAIAGIKKYLRQRRQEEKQASGAGEIIVSAFTGHGLKAGSKMTEFQVTR
jgi:threonine synthase